MSEVVRPNALANAICRMDEWTCPSGRVAGGMMIHGEWLHLLTLKPTTPDYQDFLLNTSKNGLTAFEIGGFVPSARSKKIRPQLDLRTYDSIRPDEAGVKISGLISLTPETGTSVATMAISSFLEWQQSHDPCKIAEMHNTLADILSEYAIIERIQS